MSAKAPPEVEAEQAKVKQAIRDLTLVLLYLTRWTEYPRKKLPPGFGIPWRAWKGHDWDALDRLKEEGLIDFNNRAKSVDFTDKGEREARKLVQRYRIRSVGGEDGEPH